MKSRKYKMQGRLVLEESGPAAHPCMDGKERGHFLQRRE